MATKKDLITNAAAKAAAPQQQTVLAMINGFLDQDKLRSRFESLLGQRTPQFISSLVSMVNADKNLTQAFMEAPMTVIQAALKAATYDLPIDPGLGYAYIVPFRNSIKGKDGTWTKRMEAEFIPGYKGLIQLCLRTGAYADIPAACDVREGELVSYDRLRGRAEFAWVEDEEEREKLPVIGYAAYFSLKNGAEKTLYMSVKAIQNHEKKFRKGEYMSKGWKDNFEAMAQKTVLRRLIGKYGLMSIDYRDGSAAQVNLAQAVMDDEVPDDDVPMVDDGTGEVIEVEAVSADGNENK